MRITPAIFDAFLKCATKCHLRTLGEIGAGNEYAEWVRGRDESYQREAIRRLQAAVPETERIVAPPASENRDALTGGFWAAVTNNVPGTGGVIAVTNRVSPTFSGRFYRVQQLP